MHNFASMVIEKRNNMLNADLTSQMEYSNNLIDNDQRNLFRGSFANLNISVEDQINL